MKFGLPRSPSPSPVRGASRKSQTKSATAPLKSKHNAPGKKASKSTSKPLSASQSKAPYRSGTSFGLIDSSSESDSQSSSGSDFDAHPKEYSSDEDEDYGYGQHVECFNEKEAGEADEDKARQGKEACATSRVLTPHRSTSGRSREMEEAVASIRLRTPLSRPLRRMGKDDTQGSIRQRTARKPSQRPQSENHATRLQLQSQEQAKLASQHQSQVDEIQRHLNSLRIQQENEESRLLSRRARCGCGWKKSGGDKKEEARVRREAEEKQRQEEERARKAKEEKEEAARKVKEEEERKKREEEDRRKQEEEEERKLEEAAHNAAEARRPQRRGTARISLLQLKDSVIAPVKADKEAKKAFNAIRRQITPKVGQLTNDEESINRISTQLRQLWSPTLLYPPPIYAGLCSSLAKAIILQAETEVTAEKKAAIPLARVTFNLLTSLDAVFREVFWAKLVQRTGGWVIPSIVPGQADVDGRKWGEGPKGRGRGRGKGILKGASDSTAERRMVMGYRLSESTSEAQLESAPEYSQRISGIVRVLLGDLALDVMGADAADIWGWQWVKVLELVYEGATNGLYPERGAVPSLPHPPAAPSAASTGHQEKKPDEENVTIGGNTPDGRAARARVQMEVERIVGGERKAL
ncbi:GLE1-like protein-domain-containing protein [Coprinopsis sp. MPI-PUGE-AT-0042]|nr:GLE1-like protein-domain-containing protein [Coprinopsis sp. MPI-PUGE-AT-0042]